MMEVLRWLASGTSQSLHVVCMMEVLRVVGWWDKSVATCGVHDGDLEVVG